MMCMASIVTQNVSAVVMSGLACMFKDMPLFAVGQCKEHVMVQIMQDSVSTWLGDIVSIVVYTRKGFPILYFFSMLDRKDTSSPAANCSAATSKTAPATTKPDHIMESFPWAARRFSLNNC